MNYSPDRRSTVLYPIPASFLKVQVDESERKMYFSNGYFGVTHNQFIYEYENIEDNIWLVRRRNGDVELIEQNDLLDELNSVFYGDTEGSDDTNNFVWLTQLYDSESGQFLRNDITMDTSAKSAALWKVDGSSWLMVEKQYLEFIDPFGTEDLCSFKNFKYFELDSFAGPWIALGLHFNKVDTVITDEMQAEIDQWLQTGEDNFYLSPTSAMRKTEAYNNWLVNDPKRCFPAQVHQYDDWFISDYSVVKSDPNYRIHLLVNKETRQIHSLLDGKNSVPHPFLFQQ